MPEYENIVILYLDDEEVNLFLFKANFKKKFEVLTAGSPKEAFQVLNENHDKIIVAISDMRMPIMNGLEFVEQAKAKYANISYYILTGFDHNADIEKALEENLIQKFFKKPFDVKEIEEEVLRIARIMNKV